MAKVGHHFLRTNPVNIIRVYLNLLSPAFIESFSVCRPTAGAPSRVTDPQHRLAADAFVAANFLTVIYPVKLFILSFPPPTSISGTAAGALDLTHVLPLPLMPADCIGANVHRSAGPAASTFQSSTLLYRYKMVPD